MKSIKDAGRLVQQPVKTWTMMSLSALWYVWKVASARMDLCSTKMEFAFRRKTALVIRKSEVSFAHAIPSSNAFVSHRKAIFSGPEDWMMMYVT